MYTPLYIKTDNSLQESLIKINDLIEYALKNNIKSLTITDNNIYGVMDFYKMCITNNIKPIVGLEIVYKDKKIVLYAINYDGYKNLIKLCTLLSEKEIELTDLENYSSSLVCITPFESLDIYSEIKGFYKYIYIGINPIDLNLNVLAKTNNISIIYFLFSSCFLKLILNKIMIITEKLAK